MVPWILMYNVILPLLSVSTCTPCTLTHSLHCTQMHTADWEVAGFTVLWWALLPDYFITTLFRDSYWYSKHRSSLKYLLCRSRAGKQAKHSQLLFFLLLLLSGQKLQGGLQLQEGLQHYRLFTGGNFQCCTTELLMLYKPFILPGRK